MDTFVHKDLLAVAGVQAVDLPAVGAVRQQGAGLHVVLQLGAENPQQLGADLRVVDGAGDLHPAVEVAGHKVRRGDPQPGLPPPSETVDAPVLQIAAHDAGDMDVLRPGGDAGAQAADAPQDQLDLDPCLGGLRQLVHHLPLRHGVGLDADTALGALGDLPVDELQEPGLNV